MAEKEAYTKKASAETRLKVAMRDLSEKVDQDNGTAPTEQFLSRSIATLATHWKSFEDAHNAHVELVNLEAAVPLYEAYGRVASRYDEVVEKGEALRTSRLPQAPVARPATLQEQYDLASGMRETTFGEVDDIIASVADYFKEKREETATSLENQRQELRKAEQLLKEARVYTDTMAMVMPEHAVRDRAADSAKEREGMRLISEQMKVLSLLSTAALPVTGGASRDSSYMYSRRPLPSFGGARRDYPSFRREWQSNVTGKFSAEYELREIKQNTPAEVEPDLKNLKAMKDVWEFLDRKFGRTMELASELINGLHNFKFSTKARTESARFAELDREWTKVYYDLEEVDKLDALNHEPTLTGFAHKLPSVDAKKAYGELRIKMGHECRQATPPTEVSELKIMETFMKAERERQEVFAGLLDDVGPDPKPRERTTLRQEGKRESVCYRCGKPGHLKADCPGTGGGRSHTTSQQGTSTPCPACEQSHTFQGKDGKHRPSTRLGACTVFRTLGVEERVAVIQKANGCARCLDFTGKHLRSHCPYKGTDGQPFTCTEKVNGVRCGKEHHALLHGSSNKFSCYVRVNRVHISVAPSAEEIAENENSTTLMQLQMIPVKGTIIDCLTFWDIGSNIHLVRKEYALSIGLKGTPIMLDLSTTGQKQELRESMVYWVPLLDRKGVIHNVMAYEMDNITAPMEAEDVSVAEGLFPMVSKGALKRPSGPVDLLMGLKMAGIFPYLANREEHVINNLRLMTSIFGTGFLLDGNYTGISPNVMLESPEVRDLTRRASVSQVKSSSQVVMSHRASGKATFMLPECENQVEAMMEEEQEQLNRSHMVAKNAQFQFSECEELGVSQPRRCGGCTTCVRCSSTAVALTRREQEELTLIEENVKLDVEKQEVTFHYPLIKDPKLLVDNRCAAEAIARRLESKLIKQGGIEAYNQEVEAFVDRGTFVQLSGEEMADWAKQGKPVNYISHQPVVKEQSATTKLRVVSNSSLINNRSNGLSYNDLLPKGPNSLVSLLVALIRWRCYQHCTVWDLTKAYNTVKTFEEELHMRRLVWRWGEADQAWTVFGINAMHFGDRCATTGLKVALNKVAEAGCSIDPAAAEMIRQGYVDDGIGGGAKEDVDRLMGEETWLEGKPSYSGTVPKILTLGGFILKVMVRDGEQRPEVTELLGGGVLGLPWKPHQDTIEMHFGVNLSAKERGGRVGPELTIETVDQIDTAILTRREVVSQVYSIYDPLGLLAPLVIRYKMLLQSLAAAGGGWDDELDEELAGLSKEVLRTMVLAKDIVFPRSVTPEGVLEALMELCGWWDGGKPASAACLYARYEKKVADDGGTHVLRLLMGKARVTPSSKGSEKLRRSTPRTEMRGLTMLARMTTACIPGMPKMPTRISLFGDSECTISAVDCMDGQLDIWFGNRVAEVLDHMEAWRKLDIEVDELHHWPGPRNIADIATKGKAALEDVGPDSEWQNGPWEARYPRSKWPATRDFKREVPQEEKRTKNYASFLTQAVAELGVYALIQEVMGRVRNYQQARGVVARWTQAKVKGHRAAVLDAPLAKALKVADKLLYMVGTLETNKEMAKGRKSRLIGLGPQWSKGRWVTKGRLGKAMLKVLGVTELAILMPASRLARLVMQQAHEEDHKGSTITLWRSRSNAWIWRARLLAKKVCKECVQCDARKALVQEQRMGALPLERVAAGTLPFTFICLDLLGPQLVKDMVKKRCTMKVYPMVFVCQATGALHIGVMHDYSTNAFLLQWDHYTAIRGVPAKVVSDRGSQLTSAGNTVAWGADGKQDGSKLWAEVESASARRGTEWEFVPAGAQFRNGLAEARVKAVKQTLEHMLMTTLVSGKPTLSYAELLTVLAQVANIVNDRPIWAKVLTEGDMVPLTVNQLLLGRTSTSPPCEGEVMGEEGDFRASSGYVDNLLNTWWSLWKQQGFASLLPYNRLKDERRHKNLREGDVCLLQYENKVKNTYRLCRIKEVKVSEDGLVRTVTVGYRAKRKGKLLPYVSVPLTTMDVAIQRLVLLVPSEKVTGEAEEVKEDEAWMEG